MTDRCACWWLGWWRGLVATLLAGALIGFVFVATTEVDDSPLRAVPTGLAGAWFGALAATPVGLAVGWATARVTARYADPDVDLGGIRREIGARHRAVGLLLGVTLALGFLLFAAAPDDGESVRAACVVAAVAAAVVGRLAPARATDWVVGGLGRLGEAYGRPAVDDAVAGDRDRR